MTAEIETAIEAHTALPDPKRVEVGGGVLTYREVGQGPALVLLHGIGSGSASWEAQFESLSSKFRMIAWNKPGYGGSDLLSLVEPTAADYAAALVGLFDALALASAHVLGHSLGALVAAAFARRYPERVRSLILCAPAAGYGNDDEATRQAKLRARLRPMEELGSEERAARRARELLSPSAGAGALEKVRGVMSEVPLEGFRQAAGMSSRSYIFADAREIRVPTLVMCGTEDRVTSAESSRRVADAIDGAIYRDLPGLGHACYVEDAAMFTVLLSGFVDRYG